ncbi:MAG TPA: NAD(P)H-dependent glycerol-3-phosphate dehydrogenase [Rhizomicrobium sp.]|jgi:glycerol-3-phosphate dehydrogenase (NAD(P)+)|nr:NAD(P)H-dependent glycerol-3-phosphate dehydrogenase [Rhizomicrobium sp.]
MKENTESSKAYENIGVIGAGAWGTALALAAAQAGRAVTLWAREPEVVEQIRAMGENARFLPGVKLPEAITATGEIAQAARADALLVVVPAQHLRASLAALTGAKPLVLCAKGIEKSTGKLLTEVLTEAAPGCEPAILSGPSFARDVSLGLPTAVTIAARMEIALRLQATLGHATFRPYASDDLTGVALGGAAKNVYAIACGIVDGLGLGESARAALLARSFAELTRLGQALGAKPETLMGLSGLGDLVLTATSASSRNFSFGRALGRGRTLTELAKPGHPLAEGVETAPALVRRAHAEGVELPIAEAVASVLDGSLPLDAALLRLMSRPLKPE